ncbi:MAG: hypothetical protein WCR30_04005 [Clostridia bacterium]
MFSKTKVGLNNKFVDAIVLANFSMEVNQQIVKQKHFFSIKWEFYENKMQFINFDLCFIPWKHQQKELVLIRNNFDKKTTFKKIENTIKVENFVSRYYDDCFLNSQINIKNFEGYKFIYDNTSFLAELYMGDSENCLSLLYKELPSILFEEFDDEDIIKEIFIDGSEKHGSAYIEFQFYDGKNSKKPFKKLDFFRADSLLVHVDNLEAFLSVYGKYFKTCSSPNGEGIFCCYCPNFYTKEKTQEIYDTIKKDNVNCSDKLIEWLQKAFTYHNGFYILGI